MTDIWIIRKRDLGAEFLAQCSRPAGDGPPEGWEISDFGRALFLHLPNRTWAPLVGFEAVLKPARRFFGLLGRTRKNGDDRDAQVVRAEAPDVFGNLDFSEYPELSNYLRRFRSYLVEQSQPVRLLRETDLSRVETIRGRYLAFDGALKELRINGDPKQQRRYLEDNFGTWVEILVDPGDAYGSNITLRLKPELVRRFNHWNAYPLAAWHLANNRHDVVVFTRRKRHLAVDNTDMVHRLFMLQNAVDLSEIFQTALARALGGETIPRAVTVKSFHIGQAFDQMSGPLTLEKDCARMGINGPAREQLLKRLGGSVSLCIFSYDRNEVGGGGNEGVAGVVLHNTGGLTALARDYPELVETVRARATTSPFGDYYLLSEFSAAPGSGPSGVPGPLAAPRPAEGPRQ